MKKVLLFFFLFFLPFVSAQFYWQYSQPSFFEYYGNLSFLWPHFDEEECVAAQDFLVQIPPFGCSPAVVRSDLLEEQNVPVFCQLMGFKINPLIEVPEITGITVKGALPKEIAGLQYIPARVAMLGGIEISGAPFMNNLGYVVVFLKQQINESAMPDYVKANLSAIITYNIERLYGAGRNEFILHIISDADWHTAYKDFGFWKNKGYSRLEDIIFSEGKEKAKISVWRSPYEKIASFLLGEKEKSEMVCLSGFYCASCFNMAVESIDMPTKKAKLRINGDTIWAREGSKIADGNCYVRKIEKLFGERIILDCERRILLELNPLKAKIKAVSKEEEILFKTFGIGEKIHEDVYFAAAKPEQKIIFLVKTKNPEFFFDEKKFSIFEEIVSREKDEKRILDETRRITEDREADIKILKEKNWTFIDNIAYFFDSFEIPKQRVYEDKFGKIIEDHYSKAISSYREILEKWSFEKQFGPELKADEYGAIALDEAARLSSALEKFQDEEKFLSELVEKFPNSSLAGDAEKRLQLIRTKDVSKASQISYAKDQAYFITLEKIEVPTFEELGTTLLVNGEEKNFVLDDYIDENKIIKIKGIDEFFVHFIYEYTDKEGKILKGDFALEKGKSITKSFFVEGKEKKISIVVKEINLKKEVEVVIEPIQRVGLAEANFTFVAGIEKRAIKLSPKKTAELINSTEKMIAKLDKITNKVGNFVKSGKEVCLATDILLRAKNFFSSLGGGSIARTEAMKKWKEYCFEKVSEGKYSTLHECYLEKNDEIESDIKKIKEKLEERDRILKEIEKAKAENKTENIFSILEEKLKVYEIVVEKNGEIIEAKDIIENLEKLGETGNIGREEAKTLVTDFEILKSCKNKKEKELSEEFCEKYENYVYDKLSSLLEKTKFVETTDISFYKKYKIPIPEKIGGETKLVEWSVIVVDEEMENATGGKLEKGEKYIQYLDMFVQVEQIPEINRYKIKEKGKIYKIPELKKIDYIDLEEKIKKELDVTIKGEEIFFGKLMKSEVRYYETGIFKGLPAIVPFDEENGCYVAIPPPESIGRLPSGYTALGLLQRFYICRAGRNGIIEFSSGPYGDDTDCAIFYEGAKPEACGMKGEDAWYIAQNVIDQAKAQYDQEVVRINVKGKEMLLSKAKHPLLPPAECEDFYSAKDCHILFNVCDPVICPPSRCNLGGRYYVEDVVQSGILGSVVLCLPNKEEGIMLPVCLTGIHAGLDNINTILKATRDCLKESLETGREVGICDEIKSVYICDLIWRNIGPLKDIVLPKMLHKIFGKGKGGGEYYMTKDAWDKTWQSYQYFTGTYAANTFAAFRKRSVDMAELTVTGICKAAYSGRFPKLSEFFGVLAEPESPVQFSAWFDEIPMLPQQFGLVSHYKIYFHIYAGRDEGVAFSVYLRKAPEKAIIAKIPILHIASGYIERGNYADETIDLTGAAGYDEICVRINAVEKCGFGKVSTEYAINYLTDKYIAEQAKQKIETEEECISGKPGIMPKATLLHPNIQAGIEETLEPELYKKGIIRICSSKNPAANTEPERFRPVGYCGKKEIICWLDLQSVKTTIKDLKIENETLEVAEKRLEELKIPGLFTKEEAESKMAEATQKAKEILNEIEAHMKKAYGIIKTEEREETKEIFAYFDFGSAEITEEGKKEIKKIEKFENIKENSEILIKGYASYEGTPEERQKISAERADKVAKYIIKNYERWLKDKRLAVKKIVGGEGKFALMEYGTEKINEIYRKINTAKDEKKKLEIAKEAKELAKDRVVLIKITVREKKTIGITDDTAMIIKKVEEIEKIYEEIKKNSFLNAHKARANLEIARLHGKIAVGLKKFVPEEIVEIEMPEFPELPRLKTTPLLKKEITDVKAKKGEKWNYITYYYKEGEERWRFDNIAEIKVGDKWISLDELPEIKELKKEEKRERQKEIFEMIKKDFFEYVEKSPLGMPYVDIAKSKKDNITYITYCAEELKKGKCEKALTNKYEERYMFKEGRLYIKGKDGKWYAVKNVLQEKADEIWEKIEKEIKELKKEEKR